jgi:hypothetical protein
MKISAVIFSLLMLNGCAQAATCPVRKIENHGNFLRFNGYVVKLLSLDNPDAPSIPPVWPDGMLITTTAGKTCSVGIGIIEPPFFLAGKFMLYVDTYSGSQHVQVQVDARNCGGTWNSARYVGVPKLVNGDMFVYANAKSVKIGPDCLPVK